MEKEDKIMEVLNYIYYLETTRKTINVRINQIVRNTEISR